MCYAVRVRLARPHDTVPLPRLLSVARSEEENVVTFHAISPLAAEDLLASLSLAQLCRKAVAPQPKVARAVVVRAVAVVRTKLVGHT